MSNSVYKIIELVGTSTTSWDDAARAAVERASSSLRDLRIAEVVKLDLQIKDGQVMPTAPRLAYPSNTKTKSSTTRPWPACGTGLLLSCSAERFSSRLGTFVIRHGGEHSVVATRFLCATASPERPAVRRLRPNRARSRVTVFGAAAVGIAADRERLFRGSDADQFDRGRPC